MSQEKNIPELSIYPVKKTDNSEGKFNSNYQF